MAKKKGKIIFAAIFVLVLAVLIYASGANAPERLYAKQLLAASPSVVHEQSEWNLILINADNPLPNDYEVELTELSNGQSVDSRIYPALQEMFDAMRRDGFEPVVASGYRTAAKQQSLMDDRIRAYRKEGNSYSESKELAALWVAQPGTSEHQLGLAVDINEDNTEQSSEEFYEWLSKNAPDYGFITRYPSDKSDITGISYEPWHYRYVGIIAAKEISSRSLCLEEYINN